MASQSGSRDRFRVYFYSYVQSIMMRNPGATASDNCLCVERISCIKIHSNRSLRFSKSKPSGGDGGCSPSSASASASFRNSPAQKATIKRPTKQMRFPYIRQPCNHISNVVSFPICHVLSKLEPGPPSVSSAYRDAPPLGRLI